MKLLLDVLLQKGQTILLDSSVAPYCTPDPREPLVVRLERILSAIFYLFFLYFLKILKNYSGGAEARSTAG